MVHLPHPSAPWQPPSLPALGTTWLRRDPWLQLDEVPTLEAEEAVVISDVTAQSDDVARVLRTGEQSAVCCLPHVLPARTQEHQGPCRNSSLDPGRPGRAG